MKRSLVALAAILAIPFGASAVEEWLPEPELFGYDPVPDTIFDPTADTGDVEVVFGAEKGSILFNSPKDQGIFPAPDKVREFDDTFALFEFVIKELNAKLEYDPETGLPIGWSIEADTVGPSWYFNPDIMDYVYVTDPIAVFLGGRFGYVLVDNEVRCYDPKICGGATTYQPSYFYGGAAGRYNPYEYSIVIKTEYWFSTDGSRSAASHTWRGNGGTRFNNMKADLHLTDKDGNEIVDLPDRWVGNGRIVSKRWGVMYERGERPPDLFPWNVHGAFGWHWGEGSGKYTTWTWFDMSGQSCSCTGCLQHPYVTGP